MKIDEIWRKKLEPELYVLIIGINNDIISFRYFLKKDVNDNIKLDPLLGEMKLIRHQFVEYYEKLYLVNS